ISNFLETCVSIFGEGNTWTQSRQIQEVAAVQRQIRDAFIVDDLTDCARFGIEQRYFGYGRNDVVYLAHAQVHINASLLVYLKLERRDDRSLKTCMLDRYRVVSRQQVRDHVCTRVGGVSGMWNIAFHIGNNHVG